MNGFNTFKQVLQRVSLNVMDVDASHFDSINQKTSVKKKNPLL